jgi:hypothetical protein
MISSAPSPFFPSEISTLFHGLPHGRAQRSPQRQAHPPLARDFFILDFSTASPIVELKLDLYNWKDRVIDQNSELDLATIRLAEVEAPMINPFSDIDIAKSICRPKTWPPRPVNVGNWVVMGGFPGVLRLWKQPNDYSFGSFNGGPLQVSDISATGMIVFSLDREYWVVEGEFGPNFGEFGGASGGPVFLYKDRQMDPFDLVGVICQYASSDVLLVRHVNSVQPNGTIISG